MIGLFILTKMNIEKLNKTTDNELADFPYIEKDSYHVTLFTNLLGESIKESNLKRFEDHVKIMYGELDRESQIKIINNLTPILITPFVSYSFSEIIHRYAKRESGSLTKGVK